MFFAPISSWNILWYFSLLATKFGFDVLPLLVWHFKVSPLTFFITKYPVKKPPAAKITAIKTMQVISRRRLGLWKVGVSISIL